jgi:hypothetical protein
VSDKPLQRNAADPSQVRFAKRTERDAVEQREGLMKYQMGTYQGRWFVWSELTRHHIFESITVQSSLIYAMSGRRDAGLELYAEAMRWPELYLQMQQEAMDRAARVDRTIAAAQTLSTGEKAHG